MTSRTYKVKEVADLANVTVRTLHHYDSIGLLVPSGRTAGGYRLYRPRDLLRLHQIVLGRELGLPLEQIRQMLDDPQLDRQGLLLEQKKQLRDRVHRTNAMIRSIDVALAAFAGGNEMDTDKLFDGLQTEQQAREAKQRWGGGSAYAEANARTRGYTKEDWAKIKRETDDLMKQVASLLAQGTAPTERVSVFLCSPIQAISVVRAFAPQIG